jgi:hypothetical protein
VEYQKKDQILQEIYNDMVIEENGDASSNDSAAYQLSKVDPPDMR